MVPYDARTLFDTLGGNATVVTRLDAFFSKLNAGLNDPNFYMGNEPNFATPWLYDWAGAPHRTQDVVRRIMDEAFTTASGGLPGNDDLGATSSWFVWAALGMYPEVPGVAGLAVGTPLFPKTLVVLGNRQLLKIDATGAPSRYVQSVTIGGQAWASAWIPYDTLKNGANLAFTLGDAPSTWGSEPANAPPSYGLGTFTNVTDAYDNDGVGNNGVGLANFDAGGWSYSTQEMNKAVAPMLANGNFVFNGVSFPWASGDGLDNFIAAGQTFAFGQGQGMTGARLALLGSAANGTSSGTLTLRYADGSVERPTITFSDWTLAGGSAAPAPGNTVALSMPYRNYHGGADKVATNIFYFEVPIKPGIALSSVTVPGQVASGRMHLFSLAVGQ